MNKNDLCTALKPWLARSTWHTRHPNDEGFFYEALAAIISQGGSSLEIGDLREAMREVLATSHPQQTGDAWEGRREPFVLRAEDIILFVRKTGARLK